MYTVAVRNRWISNAELGEHEIDAIVRASETWYRVHATEAFPEQVMRSLIERDPGFQLNADDPTDSAHAIPRADSLEVFVFGGHPTTAQLAASREFADELGLGLLVWRRGVTVPNPAPLDGFVLDRAILLLNRPLPFHPDPRTPQDVTISGFRVGIDETAWLDLMSAAFVNHPEQGSVDHGELLRREATPWFDPTGFLLAWRDAELVGSCWTKLHDTPDGPRGEIYVICTAPTAQGLGLGKHLVEEGLAYLERRGATVAFLYVESTSNAALRLYASLGFTEQSRDERWRLAVQTPEEPTARPTP